MKSVLERCAETKLRAWGRAGSAGLMAILLLCGCARLGLPPLPGMGQKVRIVRDDFGTPHIFARTDEGASFGLGYAQAEDRLEELLKNYRRAEGTMAEVFGLEHYHEDYIQRVWQHRAKSEAHYAELPEKTRRCIEAYQAGIKAFMKAHPEQVPAWAEELHPWQVVALSRYIIWGWPMGDAEDDLGRGGLRPDPVEYHGSNEWLIAPKRSAEGAVIALADPHLSWYDQFRFYEARMYGDDLKVSGVGILGASLPSLGHSRWCSIAMTTGSGDTADIFEETVNPANPNQYQVDGKWLDMEIRHEKIGVKKQDGSLDWVGVDIQYTKHGPIVAHKDGKAYAMAIPYMDCTGSVEQIYEMMRAKNLEEMKRALARLDLMGQNVMIGTVDGDIYYQRTGKVPIRGKGVDPTKPILGENSSNDWKGIHKAEELVQVTNPPQGYMQNCNISPFAMMKNSPMRLKDYPAYIYGAEETPPHQRAAMVVETLDKDEKVTLEEALSLAVNNQVYNSDKWQQQLVQAWAKEGNHGVEETKLFELIRGWDGRSAPESTGALAYKYWKDALPETAKVGDKMGDPPPASLTDAEIVAAVNSASAKMMKDFGRLEVPYGEVYRCGRINADGSYSKTYPVGGGNPGSGMATPRAIAFVKPAPEAKVFVGRLGQTSTQVILLTKPPKSWTALPMGESDHIESGHWDDQAEKLFSRGKLKPTYFMDKKGLSAHTERVETLDFRPN